MSNPSPSTAGSGTPNTEQRHVVTSDELPLHCPMDGMSLWNSHPRVYLPIEDTGREQCPYCGTVYILEN